jgi:hypothetical protein
MQVHRQTDNKQTGDNIKGKPSNSKARAQKAISTAVKKTSKKSLKRFAKKRIKVLPLPPQPKGKELIVKLKKGSHLDYLINFKS